MVLPHRPPVLTAKMLATIDVLSNGRLIVGCGVGWMREEFEAIGAPSYDERGSVGDEYIRAFKELWTSDNPAFEGTYCRFDQRRVRAEAGAEAPPAHLDRRREPGGAATGRTSRQCLVSYRQQPALPRGHTRAVFRLRGKSQTPRPGRRDAILPPWASPTAPTGLTTSRPSDAARWPAAPLDWYAAADRG